MVRTAQSLALIGLLLCVSVLRGEALRLAVALPPFGSVAQAIGGDRIEVIPVLRPGMDHEVFAPSPQELQRLLSADLYWASGLSFERALLPKLQRLAPGVRIVATFQESTTDHRAHDHDHDHGHEDLHRWLDPRLIAHDARALTNVLVDLDPAGEAFYQENLESFESASAALLADLRRLLEPYRGRRFYVYHAAFDHFADTFGLEQVALERDGREASLQTLSRLIRQAREDGVTVVYVQPQHRPVAAETLARQVGARLESLDPLAPDWENNLRHLADRLAAGFAEADKGQP